MKRSNSHNSLYQRIYAVARRIPSGKVATYGQIASLVDRCTARMVGYAMARIPPDVDVPWHRVINSGGAISIRADGRPCEEQRFLLESEEVVFNESGCVDLLKFCWQFSRDEETE